MELAQALGDAFELPAEVGLARVVRAVGEPDRERGRTELQSELDDRLVVLERALAHVGIGVGERSELVRDRAVAGRGRVVLERVRVHGVEADAGGVGVRPERGRIPRVVPGDVQADGAVRAGERVERGDVVDLLLGGAWLAADGEAAEPGAAGADRPRRRRDREARHLVDHGVGVDPERVRGAPAPCRGRARAPVIRSASTSTICSAVICMVIAVLLARVHRRNAVATPPSTGTSSPVVRESAPPVSATTASATWRGQHLLAEQRTARVEVAELVGLHAVRGRPFLAPGTR